MSAERKLADAERQISRQREIVARLERSSYGKSETAHVARNMLRALQEAQATHLSDRVGLSGGRLYQTPARPDLGPTSTGSPLSG